MKRLAVISMLGCPLAPMGERDTGGMSVYINQIAIGLGKLGIEVDIYTRIHEDEKNIIEQLAYNVRIIHIEAGLSKTSKHQLPQYLDSFLQGIREFSRKNALTYDLIQSHYWLSAIPSTTLAKEWNIPHVTTFHTLAEIKRRIRIGEFEPELRIHSEHWITHSIDKIIVSSEHEKISLRNLYQVQKERVEVIPPGVKLDMFCPSNKLISRAQLGLKDDHIMLFVGRMEPIKGLELILYTMANLNEGTKTRLLVIGGNDSQDQEIERLKRLSQILNINKQVSFIGRVDHHLLPTYYQAADVTVIPSYYESFGLVALESMACGTPVIASRVGGLPGIVKNNQTGYLVQSHCPDAFANRLEILLNNEALRLNMGKTSRDFANEMGWGRTAFSIMNVYKKLCVDILASQPVA